MELIEPVYFRDNESEIINLNKINDNYRRPTLVEIHLADLHFGAMDPKYQYDILYEQVLSPLEWINFDLFSINGDIFDHKFMSNSDPIMYAVAFIDKVVDLCRRKGATLVLIHGTSSHDAQQLKLFYHYLEDPTIDIRIIEQVQFEYIKGGKFLCIPEMYGMGAEYYNQFLYNERYDCALVHGTIVGSVHGANREDLDSPKYPVFSIDNFINCTGPIISGHVHTPGCFNGYYYYCGSPYRWVFGQEEEKGFLVCLHNLETQYHYMEFVPIDSAKYSSFNMDRLINEDPKMIINEVKKLQEQGVDNIRLIFNEYNKATLDMLNAYYRNNSNVKIKSPDQKMEINDEINKQIEERYSDYQYIFSSIPEEQIMVQYINQQKGYEYITSEEFVRLLSEEL